jgi:putative NIF3 family GTP cyclohydrolase 1 type 2
MKRLTSADVKQDIVLKAIARGVGIYSPHTACDNCVNGGTKYILALQDGFFLLLTHFFVCLLI